MAPSDRNRGVMEEFRSTGGRVGGPFEGQDMVILHTIGARSGAPRETPLVCLPDGGRLVVFASMGGAPGNPSWFHNVRAHPDVTVEYGTETFPARATVVEGAEAGRLYAAIERRFPRFAGYRERTAGVREIPVVALERTG